MTNKLIRIIVLLSLILSPTVIGIQLSNAENMHIFSFSKLSPPSATAPIAIVEQVNGDLVVVKDDSIKNKLTRQLGKGWGFIYLNRFLTQVLRDFRGSIGQAEMRKICKAHFSGHRIIDAKWNNIFKKEGFFYVLYSLESEEGKETELVIKYSYMDKSESTIIEVYNDPKIYQQFYSQKASILKLTFKEKNKAEKVFSEIKKTIERQVMESTIMSRFDVIANKLANEDPIEEFWFSLKKVNQKSPLFSPESFAEQFSKYYPLHTDEADKAMHFILKQLGQKKYLDIFKRAYIHCLQGIRHVFTERTQFQKYLSQLKFVPEMSKMAITEKSLEIMEYLNKELDFVDPVEFRNLMTAAEKIQKMAIEGVRFDEKSGDFTRLVKEVQSITMSGKNFITGDGGYRLSDCNSSGRPKIFPSGSMQIEFFDEAVFEFSLNGKKITRKIKLNDILLDLLGGRVSVDEEIIIKDSHIVKLMQHWISGLAKDRNMGREINKNIFMIVNFFLGKKTTSMMESGDAKYSTPSEYAVDKEEVRSVFEEYFIRKTQESPGAVGEISEVKLLRIVKHRVYLIEKLMNLLEKRIMSEEFKRQHPILQASEIYLEIIDVHPFNDGNERLARLFMNYYLIINGLPVFEVYPNNRAEFIKTVRFVDTKQEFAMFLSEQLMIQNQFLLEGSDAFHRIVPAEITVKDHLDIFPEKYGVYEALTEEVRKVVQAKAEPVIMTSFGLTLMDFYSKDLVRMAWIFPEDDEYIDLSAVTFVLTDEFVGTRHRYNDFLEKFINKLPETNRPLNVISFGGDSLSPGVQNLSSYEKIDRFNELLADLNGIDLAITSIGVNGHIGYNEMGSPFYSRGRIVDLHKSTLEHRFLGYTRAFTVGVSDILRADRIITIGVSDNEHIVEEYGKRSRLKSNAINKAIFTFDVPASFIRIKKDSNFCFMIDAETAGADLNWIKSGYSFELKDFSDTKWKGLNGITLSDEKDINEERDIAQYADAAKDFLDYLMAIPYDSETSNEKIIIGIDMGWIPDIEWFNGVISQISRIRSRDIEIIIGKGNKLADIVASRARKKGLSKTNIVLLGDIEEYNRDGYEGLMSEDIREKSFMALMDGKNLKGMSSSPKASYIMIMKWVECTIKMAFSEDPAMINFPGLERTPSKIGTRIWMMVPRANLLDICLLARVYKIEQDVLKNL